MRTRKRLLAALASVLLLAGCSALPLRVPIDPGQYRSGEETFDFGGLEVQSFTLQIPPVPLQFDPPSTRITYAEGKVRAWLSVTTPEGATGDVRVRAYISPSPGGTCSRNQVYADKYRVGEATIPVGTAGEVTFGGVLSSEAVTGVNSGRLCLGIRLAGELSDYVSAVTVRWRIVYIQVGVGIL